MHATATVTSKGQVTLPRKVRDFLNTRTVEFEISEDVVLLRPVESVSGSLSKYADKYHDIGEARKKTWEDVARERA